MILSRKLGWRTLIVLLAALACAGTWAAGQVRSIRDRSEVAKMTEKMKTICVGRFLVDVPSQAEVSLSREMMEGFGIDTVEEDEPTFRAHVVAREAEISAQGVAADANGAGGMVEARDLQLPGMIGRLLIQEPDPPPAVAPPPA